jgi:hypothetical protein
MYRNDISKFITHYVPWHWHKEVEFVYVLKGNMTVENNGNKVDLSSGDGAFINMNQLHAMRSVNNESCETINIVFDTEIIAGPPHSIYESKYVLPLTKNNEIDIILLKPAITWQNAILKMLVVAPVLKIIEPSTLLIKLINSFSTLLDVVSWYPLITNLPFVFSVNFYNWLVFIPVIY